MLLAPSLFRFIVACSIVKRRPREFVGEIVLRPLFNIQR